MCARHLPVGMFSLWAELNMTCMKFRHIDATFKWPYLEYARRRIPEGLLSTRSDGNAGSSSSQLVWRTTSFPLRTVCFPLSVLGFVCVSSPFLVKPFDTAILSIGHCKRNNNIMRERAKSSWNVSLVTEWWFLKACLVCGGINMRNNP